EQGAVCERSGVDVFALLEAVGNVAGECECNEHQECEAEKPGLHRPLDVIVFCVGRFRMEVAAFVPGVHGPKRTETCAGNWEVPQGPETVAPHIGGIVGCGLDD